MIAMSPDVSARRNVPMMLFVLFAAILALGHVFIQNQ
jgi:hypothetical protein